MCREPLGKRHFMVPAAVFTSGRARKCPFAAWPPNPVVNEAPVGPGDASGHSQGEAWKEGESTQTHRAHLHSDYHRDQRAHRRRDFVAVVFRMLVYELHKALYILDRNLSGVR